MRNLLLLLTTVGWATGRASGLSNDWVMVCCWRLFDWSFARLVAPVVTTTVITLSSNKIQIGDIPVPAYRGPPRKWPLNERHLIYWIFRCCWLIKSRHYLKLLNLDDWSGCAEMFINVIVSCWSSNGERSSVKSCESAWCVWLLKHSVNSECVLWLGLSTVWAMSVYCD